MDTIRSVLDRTRDAPVPRAPVAFGPLVSDTLTLLASRFTARGVAVSVDVPSTLPAVHGDAIGLRQVLVNLLTNALDAIEGVERIEIRGAALADGDQRGSQVELAVSDSGRGMTAEELRHADLLQGSPTLEELKERYIRRVVEKSGGNISRAAAILGVDRRSLYRMLRRYGIVHRPPTEE